MVCRQGFPQAEVQRKMIRRQGFPQALVDGCQLGFQQVSDTTVALARIALQELQISLHEGCDINALLRSDESQQRDDG